VVFFAFVAPLSSDAGFRAIFIPILLIFPCLSRSVRFFAAL
jgi:hypothetical protein